MHYQPQIAIITSIEFDHADIYADLAAVKKSFARLVSIMPPDGCLVACQDDPVVQEIVAPARCEVRGYGLAAGAEWHLRNLAVQPGRTTFEVMRRGELLGEFSSPMPGRHNALNALAVIALLDRLGVAPAVVATGLRDFQGVRRRQEVRGEVDGITVIDDFAHHPTAVSETLLALRQAYPGRRLVTVFEPRTNTSMRNVFQEKYVAAFDSADVAIIREPPALHKIPEAERFSSGRLVDDLTRRGRVARYFSNTDAILDFLGKTAAHGDVIAILSNGGFDNIHSRLLAMLAVRA